MVRIGKTNDISAPASRECTSRSPRRRTRLAQSIHARCTPGGSRVALGMEEHTALGPVYRRLFRVDTPVCEA